MNCKYSEGGDTHGGAPWVIVNQSVSPQFAKVMDSLSDEVGPGILVTGTSLTEYEFSALTVRAAPAYARQGYGLRVWSWVKFMTAALKELRKVKGASFILVATNPPFAPIVIAAWATLHGVPFGVLVWDVYPDTLIQGGLLSPNNPIARFWRRCNAFSLERAAFVITLGSRIAVAVGRDLRQSARDSILVVPNWTDLESYGPQPKNENAFAIEHGQLEVTTVLYAGNIGRSHGLLPLLAAAEQLRARRDICICIVGDGLGRAELVRYAKTRGLENVHFVERQPWSRVPEILATGEIAVVSQDPASAHLSVPSKVYSAMASGSAILALTSSHSDLASLVERKGVGINCPDGDATRIARGISALVDQPDRLEEMREQARRVAIENFGPDAAVAGFLPPLRAASQGIGRRRVKYAERQSEVQTAILCALRREPALGDLGMLEEAVDRVGIGRLHEVADLNNVSCAVGVGIQSVLGEAVLPAQWREELERNERRVLRLLSVGVDVSRALESSGRRVAAIESGGVLAGSKLPLAAFGSGDLDLLIDGTADDQVDKLLKGFGFDRMERSGRRVTQRVEYRSQETPGENLWLALGHVPFERAWMPWSVPDRSGTWLARRIDSPRASGLNVLAPSDALAFVAVHTSLHTYVRSPGLRLHLDVDRLVRDNDIDWSATDQEIRAMGVQTRSYVSLVMAEALLNTPIPPHVTQCLSPPHWKWRILRGILQREGVFYSEGVGLGRMRTILVDAMLDDEGVRHWGGEALGSLRMAVPVREGGGSTSKDTQLVRNAVGALRDWRPR